MQQDFYTNTIQSRFIKDLIYTTPIPIINTVSKGDYVFKGNSYIYKNRLIVCNETGIIGDTATYKIISYFDFGKSYPKFTERFSSNYSYYDDETHQWLGKLLRCYRDIWGLDLMPFYNCFTGMYTSGLRLTSNGVLNEENVTFKVLKIPVKFNKTYTIAIDCGSEVIISPAIISRNNMSNVAIKNKSYELTDMICGTRVAKQDGTEEFVNSYGNIVQLNSLSFKNPITYKINNTDDTILSDIRYTKDGVTYSPTKSEFLSTYEKDLYMLIQLPNKNHSSVVVLEGDYTNLDSERVFNAEYINKIADNDINQCLLSNLSLLQFSDDKNYPFADRLIEFLLWNVICHKDEIGDNILRVQLKTDWLNSYKNAIPGVWDDFLRIFIYSRFLSYDSNPNLDITGYIDKDVEDYLLKDINNAY